MSVSEHTADIILAEVRRKQSENARNNTSVVLRSVKVMCGINKSLTVQGQESSNTQRGLYL